MDAVEQSELTRLRSRIAELEDEVARLHRHADDATLPLLFDRLPGLVSYVDREFRYRYVNRNYSEWFQLPPEHFRGRKVAEALGEERFELVRPFMERALSGELVAFETSYSYAGETPRRVKARYVPDPSADGVVRGFAVLVEDITEQHIAKQELRAGEERFRRMVETSAQGIWIIENRGFTTFANQRIADILGYQPEEMLGKHYLDFIVAEEHARSREGVEKRWNGDMTPQEYRAQRRDGVLVWLEFSASVLSNDAGQPIGLLGMITDVTARRAVEEGVRDANQKLNAIIQASPLAIIALSAQGDVTLWNPAAERTFGWSQEEVLGKPLPFIPEDKREQHRAMRARDLRGEGFTGIELRRQRKDGSAIDISVSTAPLRDPSGAVTGIMSLYVDITDAKRTQEALRRSEARYRFLAEALPQLVWTSTPYGGVQWVNRHWIELTGLDVADLEQRSWMSLVHPGDLPNLLEAARISTATGAPFQAECRVRRASDGEYRWLLAHSSPYYDGEGERVWLGTAVDITDRRSAEAALAESEELYRFLTNSIPQMIWTAGANGLLDYVNKNAAAYFNAPEEQILAAGWIDFIHSDDRAKTVERWRESLTTGSVYETEFRLRRFDGDYRWHLVRALPYRRLHGETRWFGTCTDIEDNKRIELELRRANEDLEQFAYSASHDLQEPLRQVATFTELLKRRYGGRLGQDADEYISFAVDGAHRMENLVRDLLAYTRAGVEVAEGRQAADPKSAIEKALKNLHGAVLSSGARVIVDHLPRVRGVADSQLMQLFQNLIGNAIKYRSGNPPVVHISSEGQGEFVLFRIEDNGIGIEKAYQRQIFGIFKRLHANEQYAGTGIGLAICQKIVDRAGGKIWVESASGQGSTFFVTLPAAEPEPALFETAQS